MNRYIKPMCPICGEELYLSVPVYGQRDLQIGERGKSLKVIRTSTLEEGEGELCCDICNKVYSHTWDKKNRIILRNY